MKEADKVTSFKEQLSWYKYCTLQVCFGLMPECQHHKSCKSTYKYMSKNVITSIKKKLGGLEHGDECPKRICHSQVSDLVFKRYCWFSGEIC